MIKWLDWSRMQMPRSRTATAPRARGEVAIVYQLEPLSRYIEIQGALKAASPNVSMVAFDEVMS
jgi:hypothetical protein